MAQPQVKNGLSFHRSTHILRANLMKSDRWVIGIALLFLAGCATLESQGEFAAGRQALIKGDASTALTYFQRVAGGDPNYVTNYTVFRESIWTYVGRSQYSAGKFGDARQAFEKALSYVNDDQLARLYLGLTLLRLPQATTPSNAFTLQEVLYALREGIEPKRVAALAHERGIGFDLTKESENQLRNAGADSFLVDEIKKIRAESVKKRPENQTSQGAKEIASALAGLRDALDYAIAHSTQGRFWDPTGEIRTQIKSGLSLLTTREPDWQKVISTGEWIGQTLEEEIDRARRDEADDRRRNQAR
jgi:tetratricopeptide (TPR) repeat protein